MNAPPTLDSLARHRAFKRAYHSAGDLQTERDRARATDAAHLEAERAMQGLDDAATAIWLHAGDQFRKIGASDRLARAVADSVFAAVVKSLRELGRI